MASPPSTFAVLLRRYRDAVHLTQEELAERAGLSVRGISDLERGISRAPYRATVRQLADALDLGETDRVILYAARESTESAAPPVIKGGFLGARPAHRLVARDAEWDKILRAIDAVATGPSRLILLVGEAGAGKTRLAQEAAIEAARRGFLVATGRCYEPQGTVPFYPFLEILTTLWDRGPREVSEGISQRWPSLFRLLPERVETAVLKPDPVGSMDDVHRMLRTVAGFVHATVDVIPTALLLDDLHWTDGASLDLLQHLIRYSAGQRLLLLATYRGEETGSEHPLRQALRDLHREGLVERIPVMRLGQEGTARLLAERLGEEVSVEFAALVHRTTEGNAFFVSEVLRALIERGDVYRQHDRWLRKDLSNIEVPESVREAITERRARLNPGTQAVLDVACLLGTVFTFDDLLAVGEYSDEEIETALGESEAVGLVRPAGSEEYIFDHGLTQQVLYNTLPPRRRKRLHHRTAEALERRLGRERRAADIARHFREGGDPGRAVPYYLLAGDAAEAVSAHGEAEQHYRTALALAGTAGAGSMGGLDNRVGEREALEKLGVVLCTVSRYDDALQTLDQALSAYRMVNDEEGEVRVTAQIAWTHFFRGTAAEGTREVEPLLARLEKVATSADLAPASPALAALWSVSAALLWADGRFEDQLSAAERASQLARAVGDDRILVRADLWRAYAFLAMERLEEGVPILEGVIALAEEVGELTILARALNALSADYEERGEFAKEKRYLDRALLAAERTRDPALITLMLLRQGQHAFCVGEWARARQFWEEVVATSRSMGASRSAPYASIGLGTLLQLQGDEAMTQLKTGLAVAQRNHDFRAVREAQAALARRDFLAEEPRSAWERLSPLLGVNPAGQSLNAAGRSLKPAGRSVGDDTRTLSLLPLAAQVQSALGDEMEAANLADRAVARAVATDDKVILIEARHVQGLLAARRGDEAAAAETWREALALARAIGFPHGEARILVEWGRLAASRPHLEDALAIFERLGARPEAERAARALAELPVDGEQ